MSRVLLEMLAKNNLPKAFSATEFCSEQQLIFYLMSQFPPSPLFYQLSLSSAWTLSSSFFYGLFFNSWILHAAIMPSRVNDYLILCTHVPLLALPASVLFDASCSPHHYHNDFSIHSTMFGFTCLSMPFLQLSKSSFEVNLNVNPSDTAESHFKSITTCFIEIFCQLPVN